MFRAVLPCNILKLASGEEPITVRPLVIADCLLRPRPIVTNFPCFLTCTLKSLGRSRGFLKVGNGVFKKVVEREGEVENPLAPLVGLAILEIISEALFVEEEAVVEAEVTEEDSPIDLLPLLPREPELPDTIEGETLIGEREGILTLEEGESLGE